MTDYTTLPMLSPRWVRSPDGFLAGVCEGLARSFGFDPWLVRLGWLLSVLCLGTGLLLYAILAFCLPRADQLAQSSQRRLLGVCARLSRVTGLEVGLVRCIAVMLTLLSFGATIVGYIVLHFVVPTSEHDALVY